MYLWLVFVHVLSGFIFFLSHGAAAFGLLKMPQEREQDRIKALLDLRTYADPWMSWSSGVLFLSGIVAGFMGQWWGKGWIWVSLVPLILVSLPMTRVFRTQSAKPRDWKTGSRAPKAGPQRNPPAQRNWKQ